MRNGGDPMVGSKALSRFVYRNRHECHCYLTVENHCMSNVFEIRDPDTGAVIERVDRKDMPPAARQAMAEAFQGMLERREIVFTGERNAKGKPIYRSMIYEGDRDPRREN